MSKRKPRMFNTETWVEEAIRVHGSLYDYTKVCYKNSSTPVAITCKKHGEFYQQPRHHINGSHCPHCQKKAPLSNATFLKRARGLHGSKYQYPGLAYKNLQTVVTITCPIHGDFKQRAHNHLQGYGCTKCGRLSTGKILAISQEEFVKRARAVHGDTYQYTGRYVAMSTPVEIMCPIHGPFEQRPLSHFHGSGCPICSHIGPSRPELAIRDVVAEAAPSLDWSYNRRDIIPPQEIDIYCPETKLGIEFNGSYWHSEKFHELKTSHQRKTLKAWSEGLQLLHIWEHEWKDEATRAKWTAVLNRRLGRGKVIEADQLEVRHVDSNIGSFLLDLWDLQGGVSASSWLSLWDVQERVLAVMALARPRKGAEDWALLRYCERPGFSLEGGMQRLFDHWRPEHPGSVLAYIPLDLAGPEKCPLEEIGFSLADLTAPDYIWEKGGKCITRYQASSSKIQSMLPEADLELTEVERMQALGFNRAYDSGRAKFVLPAGAASNLSTDSTPHKSPPPANDR